MKVFFLFFVFMINEPILEAKIDTALLLVIESSIQNNDFDILCALRESIFNLTRQKADGEFDIAITYIDQLHQCNSAIKQTSTTEQTIYRDEPDFEKGLFKN